MIVDDMLSSAWVLSGGLVLSIKEVGTFQEVWKAKLIALGHKDTERKLASTRRISCETVLSLYFDYSSIHIWL